MGVAAGEAVNDEDFKEQLETLNEELETGMGGMKASLSPAVLKQWLFSFYLPYRDEA